MKPATPSNRQGPKFLSDSFLVVFNSYKQLRFLIKNQIKLKLGSFILINPGVKPEGI